MRISRVFRVAAALNAGASVLGVSALASAEDCPTLTRSVYGVGGSAITATLAKVATVLAGLDDPVNVFYADPSACSGFQQFLDNAITSKLKYWTADGVQHECDPPLVTGFPADFAHMGNAADFCPDQTLPDDVGDFLGPVQTVNVITHVDSKEDAISAAALYFVYGFGPAGEAAPWVNENSIYSRSPTSFVHLLLAKAINVPPTSFKTIPANVLSKNPETVTAVFTAGVSDPKAALGYVSGSAAAAAPDQVKTLAYQHYDQTCGYLPDSSPTIADKQNVRSGQYYLWNPGHFYARVDSGGDIIAPEAANLIGWFTGTKEASFDITGEIIAAGDVPLCAMRASRAGTLGPISSTAPENPCGCFYDYKATGETTCDSCETDDECGADNPKCRFGFCEAY